MDKMIEQNGSIYAAGTKIKIVGLSSQPQLNDSEAEIIEWDAAKQKYKVLLTAMEGREAMLKEKNIQLIKVIKFRPILRQY